MAAVFNLNHHASYVRWHSVMVSVPNLLVIAAMVVLFAVAIWVRLPSHDRRRGMS
jgi:hypothetical protein